MKISIQNIRDASPDSDLLCIEIKSFVLVFLLFQPIKAARGQRQGSTVVKVLCYKSEGRWFDPSWCQWIFH